MLKAAIEMSIGTHDVNFPNLKVQAEQIVDLSNDDSR